MGVSSGPQASKHGLMLSLDAGNVKSTADRNTARVRVLIVGGGGGGGMDMGGGGGGGGVIRKRAFEIPVGVDLPVVIGAGGYGAPAGSGGYRTDGAGPQPSGHQFTISATAGGSSSFYGLTALGGGYGGSSYYGYTPNYGIAGNGATGGGNSGYTAGATTTAPLGTTDQGFRGGNAGGGSYYSGGGGGAGRAGTDGPNTPHGGDGILDDILGTSYYWGGGGGGASYSSGQGGNGGLGGGGGGANGTTTGGAGYNNGSPGGGGPGGAWANTPGGNAGKNTGGGGGGGAHYNATNQGGEGGSGIVVIRYPGSQRASGGNIITTVGSDTVHIFTSGGTFRMAAATNTRTYNNNILDWTSWVPGTTDSASGYGANGSTGENGRQFNTDPWGSQSIVWESRPSGNGNDDGGWNTSWFNIDKTKKYRFSVWMRRTSASSGGTFYMGMYANGSGARHMSDGTYNGNPYWVCWGTGSFTQNQWYLFVGHVYPYETSYTGMDADSGYYTVQNGKIGTLSCNIGSGDLKWPADATQGLHRTYHYYCGDSTTRLEFFQPRVDLCDGTEPSIGDLLSGSHQTWKDLSPSDYKARMSVLTNANLTTVGGIPAWETNDSNYQGFRIPSFPYPQSGRTYEVWLNSKSYSIGWQTWTDDSGSERILFGTSSNALQVYPDLSFSAGLQPNTWYQLVYTLNGAIPATCVGYVNGVQIGSGTYSSSITGGSGVLQLLGDYGSEISSCYCGLIRVYNRPLSATEVRNNFNATRGRFGI